MISVPVCLFKVLISLSVFQVTEYKVGNNNKKNTTYMQPTKMKTVRSQDNHEDQSCHIFQESQNSFLKNGFTQC